VNCTHLGNKLGERTDVITRSSQFLTRYGFAEQVMKHELLVRRSLKARPPGDALRILGGPQSQKSAFSFDSSARTSSLDPPVLLPVCVALFQLPHFLFLVLGVLLELGDGALHFLTSEAHLLASSSAFCDLCQVSAIVQREKPTHP